MPPTCPTDSCAGCNSDYNFTLSSASCGILDCSGSYIVNVVGGPSCSWAGSGGTDACDATIECSGGYWVLTVTDGSESCIWKRKAKGDSDCPDGAYFLSTDGCGDCDAIVSVAAGT